MVAPASSTSVFADSAAPGGWTVGATPSPPVQAASDSAIDDARATGHLIARLPARDGVRNLAATAAARLDHAVTAFFLAVALDVAPDGAAGHGAGHRRDLAAAAAADLVADQAADHGARGGAADAVGVGRGPGDLDVLADHAGAVAEGAALVFGAIGLCLRHACRGK